MTRAVSTETRGKISRSMKGKRNAAGPHEMTPAGSAAISAAQTRRWEEFRRRRREEG